MYSELLKFAQKFASKADYMREYMKNRYHKKRQEIIDSLGGKCVSCGDTAGPFHLDHMNAKDKKFRASDLHSVNDSDLKKEMKNLQILCSPCHKKKTHESWDYGQNKPKHGTYWMYRKYKCRCDECVDSYKAKLKEWRGNEKTIKDSK